MCPHHESAWHNTVRECERPVAASGGPKNRIHTKVPIISSEPFETRMRDTPSNHEAHTQTVGPTLERHGIRPTRQREVVFAALRDSRTHPTAEELHAQVREREPGLSLATVYNTLEALCVAGLCRRVPTFDTRGGGKSQGACRFDADLSPHAHASLPDGRVVDLPESVIRPLLEALQGETRAEIARIVGQPIDRLSVQVIVEPPGVRGA